MAALFTAQYQWLWTLALWLALFLPVRQLIWILSVRRAERRDGNDDEVRRQALKRRAGVTSALLCFAFSVFYISTIFTPQS